MPNWSEVLHEIGQEIATAASQEIARGAVDRVRRRYTARLLESDQQLQDLVLTVHHCYMHTLTNTPAFKIIENQRGVAFIKQQATLSLQMPTLAPGP